MDSTAITEDSQVVMGLWVGEDWAADCGETAGKRPRARRLVGTGRQKDMKEARRAGPHPFGVGN
jgi:hypothetical protein